MGCSVALAWWRFGGFELGLREMRARMYHHTYMSFSYGHRRRRCFKNSSDPGSMASIGDDAVVGRRLQGAFLRSEQWDLSARSYLKVGIAWRARVPGVCNFHSVTSKANMI